MKIKVLEKYPIIKEMFLYGIIGVLSSTIDSLFFILLTKVNFMELIANFISVNIGITVSFFLNTYCNFKQKNNLGKKAISFFGVGYIGLAISTLIIYIFITKLRYNAVIVKIVSVIIVAMIQFILNKVFTYKKGVREDGEKTKRK